MKENYQKTTIACFTGYIVQAIVNNFVPLLFVTFQKSYNISLSKITALITINFIIQLVIDMLSAGFIDKIGYRASIIIAHIFSAAGLVSLVLLPAILPDAFLGIVIAVIIYAIGGGLIEVLISPVMEACPTDIQAFRNVIFRNTLFHSQDQLVWARHPLKQTIQGRF